MKEEQVIKALQDLRLTSSLTYELSRLITILSEDHNNTDEVVINMFKMMLKSRVEVNNRDISEKDEIRLFEEGFNKLKSNLTEAIIQVKQEQISRKSENIEDEFLANFSESDVMSKTQAAKFCEKSEQFIHNHKKKFSQSRNGVNVLSFLNWLKAYNTDIYITFKANYIIALKA